MIGNELTHFLIGTVFLVILYFIFTIVFPGTRNVKYLPIFHSFFSLVGMRVVLNVFLVIQNTDFFIQISKMSIVSISSIE